MGAFTPGKPAVDYTVVKKLKGSPDWQTVSVGLKELVATDPKITAPLANWQTVTEFSISPSGETVKNGQKVKVDGKAWQGPREIRNLRWEGGEITGRGGKQTGGAIASRPVARVRLSRPFRRKAATTCSNWKAATARSSSAAIRHCRWRSG